MKVTTGKGWMMCVASAVAVSLLGSASALSADSLHGYCAGTGQCVDNGTNSPTSINPPSDFGFTVASGPTSGDFVVDLLVPNNEEAGITTFGITGTLPGTATLFSPTDWTSGQLDAYLGISASPTNPIGAFLPSTQALDPGATGFSVYQADLGTFTLQSPSNPNVSPLENLSQSLPEGSYIVGFLNEGTSGNPNWTATANSAAIFETSAVPEPSYSLLLGLGLIGVPVARRFVQRRRT
jgi:hypothetical protein